MQIKTTLTLMLNGKEGCFKGVYMIFVAMETQQYLPIDVNMA